jgi:hypothetical protein
MKTRSILGIAAAAALGASTLTTQAAECIAPANPGGGWDFTCRTIGKIMYDIGVVSKPVQVTNMSGGGGGLVGRGFRAGQFFQQAVVGELLLVKFVSAESEQEQQHQIAGHRPHRGGHAFDLAAGLDRCRFGLGRRRLRIGIGRAFRGRLIERIGHANCLAGL